MNRDERIHMYGTEGERIISRLRKETDPDERRALERRLDELKRLMRDIGVPTIEEAEADPEYWARVSASYYLEDLKRRKDA